MKACLKCKKPLVRKRKQAKFCSDECRTTHNNAQRSNQCAACRMHHPSVQKKGQTCTHCQYWDLVKIERKEILPRLQWIRDKALCVYCGEFSEEIEHVIPKSANLPTYTVQACGECNRMAAGTLLEGFREKLEHIRKVRRKRYAKLLRMPVWDPEELEELEGRLRTHTENLLKSKEIVEAQLAWNPLFETI